ncbi:MAG: hypothetical protein ACLQNE_36340 [Thermoguttaceae bacterium]|jgi:ferredoxin-NADP reductase
MSTIVASPTYLMKLKSRQEVAEQTMAFRFEKPASLTFTPGQFIITGPPTMVRAIHAMLKGRGVDDENIRIEEFTGY